MPWCKTIIHRGLGRNYLLVRIHCYSFERNQNLIVLCVISYVASNVPHAFLRKCFEYLRLKFATSVAYNSSGSSLEFAF